MDYKVIKEFPGLKIGDILVKEDNGDFYSTKSIAGEYSENLETVSISTVALGTEIVESETDYFQKVEEVSESTTPLDTLINEMLQTAAILEGDKVTALNAYHLNIVEEMLSRIYKDANFLTSLK